MKPPKPTGFKVDTPPEIYIRDLTEPEEEPEDDTFEIKSPFLANLFHYGMIGFIFLIVFAVIGSLLGFNYLRRGGNDSLTLILTFAIGGGFGVLKIIHWIKTSDYRDKDDGGF